MSVHLPFFFDAMINGYAGDGDSEKTTIQAMPGSKVFIRTYSSADCPELYRIVDCWVKNGEKSSGHTDMWRRGEPIWSMHYGGWYAAEALPFLKECLLRAYVRDRKFYGGRGPAFVRADQFTYVNRYYGSFEQFNGEESIHYADGRCAGFHWYHGFLLAEE